MHQGHLFYFLGHSDSAERKSQDTHKPVQMPLHRQVVLLWGNALFRRNPGPVQIKSKTPNNTKSTYRCPWTA